MARTRPVVSTAMCRLRPLTFLALSQPRVAFGTVPAARTDWEAGDRRGGFGVPSGSGPDQRAQGVVEPGQGTVVAPGGLIVTNRDQGARVRHLSRTTHPARLPPHTRRPIFYKTLI